MLIWCFATERFLQKHLYSGGYPQIPAAAVFETHVCHPGRLNLDVVVVSCCVCRYFLVDDPSRKQTAGISRSCFWQ